MISVGIPLTTLFATSVGDNSDLKVLGQTHDIFSEIRAPKSLDETGLGMRHEYLCDVIRSGEFNNGSSDVRARDRPRFNA